MAPLQMMGNTTWGQRERWLPTYFVKLLVRPALVGKPEDDWDDGAKGETEVQPAVLASKEAAR